MDDFPLSPPERGWQSGGVREQGPAAVKAAAKRQAEQEGFEVDEVDLAGLEVVPPLDVGPGADGVAVAAARGSLRVSGVSHISGIRQVTRMAPVPGRHRRCAVSSPSSGDDDADDDAAAAAAVGDSAGAAGEKKLEHAASREAREAEEEGWEPALVAGHFGGFVSVWGWGDGARGTRGGSVGGGGPELRALFHAGSPSALPSSMVQPLLINLSSVGCCVDGDGETEWEGIDEVLAGVDDLDCDNPAVSAARQAGHPRRRSGEAWPMKPRTNYSAETETCLPYTQDLLRLLISDLKVAATDLDGEAWGVQVFNRGEPGVGEPGGPWGPLLLSGTRGGIAVFAWDADRGSVVLNGASETAHRGHFAAAARGSSERETAMGTLTPRALMRCGSGGTTYSLYPTQDFVFFGGDRSLNQVEYSGVPVRRIGDLGASLRAMCATVDEKFILAGDERGYLKVFKPAPPSTSDEDTQGPTFVRALGGVDGTAGAAAASSSDGDGAGEPVASHSAYIRLLTQCRSVDGGIDPSGGDSGLAGHAAAVSVSDDQHAVVSLLDAHVPGSAEVVQRERVVSDGDWLLSVDATPSTIVVGANSGIIAVYDWSFRLLATVNPFVAEGTSMASGLAVHPHGGCVATLHANGTMTTYAGNQTRTKAARKA